MRRIWHHIIQRWNNGTNHPNNIHKRDERLERAYHTVFPWLILPVERIQRILDLDKTAYNPEVVAEIERVIDEARRAREDAYDYRCIKKKGLLFES